MADTRDLNIVLGDPERAKVREGEKHRRSAQIAWSLVFVLLAASIALAAAFALTYLGVFKSKNSLTAASITAPIYDTVVANKANAVYDPFNATELSQIADHVRSKLSLLEAQPEDMLGDWLYGIEHLPASKASVLAYLDGSPVAPGRYARAVVYHLADPTSAKIVEYQVGPIHAFPLDSAKVQVSPMTVAGPHNSTDIPYMMRPATGVEYGLMDVLVAAECEVMDGLFVGSYGETYADGNIWWGDAAPRGDDRNARVSWIWFTWYVEGSYLQVIGLSALVNHTSLNSSEWSIAQWVYNGQVFNSSKDLQDAYDAGTLDKLSFPKPTSSDWSDKPLWSSLRRRGAEFPNEQRSIPIMVNPQGVRYSVNGRHVSWLGWSMHLGQSLQLGLSLNDIRFDSERIIYELSLQNAFAGYSGFTNPIQAASQYSDNGWGMGWDRHELIPGVDCPSSATFLPNDFYVDGTVRSVNRSVCVFEQPDNLPIMRHYEKYDDDLKSTAGIPRTSLVVRTVATVYNYDYIISYVFYMDASVQAQVHATGYIQAGSYPTNPALRDIEAQFSVPVKEHVMGTLHDHFYNYKVDLDVLGTANSVKRVAVAAKQYNLPYAYPSQTVFKYVNYTPVTSEGNLSLYEADLKDPAWYTFSNPDAAQPNNSQGMPRSWRIFMPGTNVQQASGATWGPSLQYMKYNVAVLQRKEDEQFSGYGLYDMQAPGEPLRQFDDYINGESLVQEDLVAWVTVGKLHLPSAEDLPVTSTPATEASFYIRPANYFDESPAIRLTRKYFKTHNVFEGHAESNIDTAAHHGEFACSAHL